MEIEIITCDKNDLDSLVKIGIETYYDTFQHFCIPETMESYLKEAFEKSKILAEITNENCLFFFVLIDNDLAGYMKININTAQSDLREEQGLELERIYVRNPYQGMGVGTMMIDLAVDKAKEHQKEFVWLGVWEINTNAIEFYKKKGFIESGSHTFRMGEKIQTDYIMKKYLKQH